MWLLIITFAGGDTSAVRPSSNADVTRQIYISATDKSGSPVADLTAGDISIKEGGKERAVQSVNPANGPIHVAFLVDDAGTGAFQSAVAQFMDRMQARGLFSITLLNPQASLLVDFTSNPPALRDALGRLGKRGRMRRPTAIRCLTRLTGLPRRSSSGMSSGASLLR